jgi:ureidoglycolate lyase
MIEPMNSSSAAPPDLHLHAQALNAQDMAPYGWVLDTRLAFTADAGRLINAGTSRRADFPGELVLNTQGARPLACVFRARGQAVSGPWRMLERHRLGTQTFVPLGGAAPQEANDVACVLLVALGTDAPDLSTLRAFRVNVQQAFTLKPGTWHHPLIATHDRDFLVLERSAETVDCEVVTLERAVTVQALSQGA